MQRSWSPQAQTRSAAALAGYRVELPKFTTFVKTILLWLAVTVVAMLLWMEYYNYLPASWDVPLGHETVYAMAWSFTALSALVLAYELLTISPQVTMHVTMRVTHVDDVSRCVWRCVSRCVRRRV